MLSLPQSNTLRVLAAVSELDRTVILRLAAGSGGKPTACPEPGIRFEEGACAQSRVSGNSQNAACSLGVSSRFVSVCD